MTEKKRDIRNAVEQTALKVIDEKNDRIRKLEIVILTLSEEDEKSRGGNHYTGTRKTCCDFLQHKMRVE